MRGLGGIFWVVYDDDGGDDDDDDDDDSDDDVCMILACDNSIHKKPKAFWFVSTKR